jgi:hypothetical protein
MAQSRLARRSALRAYTSAIRDCCHTTGIKAKVKPQAKQAKAIDHMAQMLDCGIRAFFAAIDETKPAATAVDTAENKLYR